MKKYIFLVLCLIVTGCVTKPVTLNNTFPCNKTKEEMQNELIRIATTEGLSLSNKSFDSNNIVIEFRMNNTIKYNISWNFLILEKEKTIIAVPKIHYPGYESEGVHNASKSYVLGDEADEDFTEYWNIRAKLERFCGAKVKIVMESANKRSLKEESLGK